MIISALRRPLHARHRNCASVHCQRHGPCGSRVQLHSDFARRHWYDWFIFVVFVIVNAIDCCLAFQARATIKCALSWACTRWHQQWRLLLRGAMPNSRRASKAATICSSTLPTTRSRSKRLSPNHGQWMRFVWFRISLSNYSRRN